ncbi:hypothetical protein MKW98_004990 [Papaver atlanticum]|uniref:HTH La-type RNA-binding domain-containing protein n=1 Tax=Papaver atlanticum TaxID=357466 RepID=A0AAD4XX28_9MAGN|nr:hypothetical protein MKW98_004990 [Papaver atlanticum]
MNSANNRNASAAARARARDLSSTDVKSAFTSSSKASCNNNNDNNINCTSDGARTMGVTISSRAPASRVPDPSMKDSSHKMNSLEGGSKGGYRCTPQQVQKSHQRNSSFWRGPHPPGDSPGSYRQNHNSHRSFNGRDAQQHQRMQPTMINPRNNYISPPPAIPDHHDMYFTIAKQTEYYFSPVSLWKNIFLRRHMNEQGWVPVSVIAGIHQVEKLMKGIPDKIQYILDAVRASTIVETKGDKIRKRYDWIKWILNVPKDGNSANPEMNNHLPSSNEKGSTSESNKLKDLLKEFSAWDKIEDLQTSFINFTWKLP